MQPSVFFFETIDAAAITESSVGVATGYGMDVRGVGVRAPLGSRIFFSGVGLTSPLGTAATSDLLYKPQMVDEGDCGAIGGMKIGRGNRNTRRKPAPAPLCPPQIPHGQTRARTRAAAVGSQRLTA
jgi:hypothetical protein